MTARMVSLVRRKCPRDVAGPGGTGLKNLCAEGIGNLRDGTEFGM